MVELELDGLLRSPEELAAAVQQLVVRALLLLGGEQLVRRGTQWRQ